MPNFNPDGETGWSIDRPAADDFLPPDSGPGPVLADPKHPYVPNGQGQSTYRVADLTNPILKPWVVAQMKKTNDDVLAGKVPFIARERCWPPGVPGLDIYNRGQPVHFIQTPKEVVIINELYASTRHIYMNVPHSAHPKPSWYGESIGHYEGDELVVDTIGLNDRTFVDNYRTPHTTQMHVIERFRMINGGKTLQVLVHVEDPWRIQHAVECEADLGSGESRALDRGHLRAEQRFLLRLWRRAAAARRPPVVLSATAAGERIWDPAVSAGFPDKRECRPPACRRPAPPHRAA